MSPAYSSDSEPSPGSDDQYDEKNEVHDLHHFVKNRQLHFQCDDADPDEKAGNPGTEKGTETSPIDEFFQDPLLAAVGMSVSHPDKLVVR